MNTTLEPELAALLRCPAPGCTNSLAGSLHLPPELEPWERRARVLRMLESHGRLEIPAKAVKLTADPGPDGHGLTRATRAADSVQGARVVKTARAAYLFGTDLLEMQATSVAFCRLVEARGWVLQDCDVPGSGRWCCRVEHVPEAVSHFEEIALEVGRQKESGQ